MDKLQRLELENLQMSKALVELAHYCTCTRPAVKTPDGGVRAPGPHTSKCVSKVAIQALKPVD